VALAPSGQVVGMCGVSLPDKPWKIQNARPNTGLG
jgi:hypothetical protein